ncbi:glycosyl hydrolase family 85-domain-containing protein [Suillus cothurnatus]|nr:glycosyl hydrolase family 85-domain-containing protein [Suillus cothurnatus]
MGVLEYQARPQLAESLNRRGKLLGGYTESPSGLCYTSIFGLYVTHSYSSFSHHRITVPPSGWTNAAHRQGVKMLGTLIFEGSGEADCLQLIVGCPQAGAGPTLRTDSIPISRRYASVLAELARQRGFDGYLLNVECPLRGGPEQARALAGWILLLRSELVTKVGPHAQVIWYDSVIFNGQLRWQDRLNSLNLPFFLSSDALFTNYFWPPSFPALTTQYFMSLDPTLISDDAKRSSISSVKSLQNIFTGVDVWGRGSHGGGGFGSYKAMTHIDPQSLGLSVALFGQAWTWESEQDKPGWNWDRWWEYERKLWVGPADPQEVVPVPDAPRRPGEPECPHDAFEPVSSFLVHATPPNPSQLTENGWTDVDKQSSIGNLVWPRPSVTWENNDSSSMLDMSDAWNGGNTLKPMMHFFRVYLASCAVVGCDFPCGTDLDLGLSSSRAQFLSFSLPPGIANASIAVGLITVSFVNLPGNSRDSTISKNYSPHFFTSISTSIRHPLSGKYFYVDSTILPKNVMDGRGYAFMFKECF